MRQRGSLSVIGAPSGVLGVYPEIWSRFISYANVVFIVVGEMRTGFSPTPSSRSYSMLGDS
jgi:hypothetical protein